MCCADLYTRHRIYPVYRYEDLCEGGAIIYYFLVAGYPADVRPSPPSTVPAPPARQEPNINLGARQLMTTVSGSPLRSLSTVPLVREVCERNVVANYECNGEEVCRSGGTLSCAMDPQVLSRLGMI